MLRVMLRINCRVHHWQKTGEYYICVSVVEKWRVMAVFMSRRNGVLLPCPCRGENEAIAMCTSWGNGELLLCLRYKNGVIHVSVSWGNGELLPWRNGDNSNSSQFLHNIEIYSYAVKAWSTIALYMSWITFTLFMPCHCCR